MSVSELKEYLRGVNKRFNVGSPPGNNIITHHNAKWRKLGKPDFDVPPERLWDNMKFTINFIETHIIPKVESRIGKTPQFKIYSGWRNQEYTNIINGSSTSQHTKFTALDIHTENFPRDVFREVCDEVFWGVGQSVNMGLGFYPGFTHIDVSENQSRRAPYTWFRHNKRNIRRLKGEILLSDRGISSRIRSEISSTLGEGADGMPLVDKDFLFDEGKREKVELDVRELGKFLTPEEYRKGIVAQVYYVNDWHLSLVGNTEHEDNKRNQAIKSTLPDGAQDALSRMREEREGAGETGGDKSSTNSDRERGDLSLDPRKRYVMSLVDAEFYRRRFQSRQVPAASGPFNPYPVPGFPALIMTPGRPIIGMATNVTHQISVSAGSGTTSVSIAQPRYWDEGDVWHWLGGWSIDDWDEQGFDKTDARHLYQRFPLWQNRHTMATNNYNLDTGEVTRTSDLDYFYRFMLGCDGIPYRSNNWGRAWDTEVVAGAIRDRKPANFEVHPETLAVQDYNEYIAATDDDGKFKQGTLAFDIFGHEEPYHVHESNISVEKQVEFTERYGISERDLFVDFLGNEYKTNKGRLMLVGKTFGEKGNNLQKQVIEYMEDLERRMLESSD